MAPQVEHEEITAYFAESTGLDTHKARTVPGKVWDAILHYAHQGRGVETARVGRAGLSRRLERRVPRRPD